MRTEALTLPAVEPLLLDEVKDHLRMEGAAEDAALGAFITAARLSIEEYADLRLIDRTEAIYLDAWPLFKKQEASPWWSGSANGAVSLLSSPARFAVLPVRPVSAVASITVVAADDSETVWDADNYQLRLGLKPGVVLQAGRRWPVPGRVLGGLKITLTSGFGPDWNYVPASVRQAILMQASYLYTHRGDNRGGTSNAVVASGAAGLLAPYRERRV